jgi:opacity protein-like surface antigen
MKTLVIAVIGFALGAAPSFAQEAGGPPANGYASIFGGPVWAAGNSTGAWLFEGGARIAPHLIAFGSVGRFANLQAGLQPTLDAATAALANDGIGVTGGGSLPAWYGVGGLRAEIASSRHVRPYVLGGLGAAHLSPAPQFTFTTGTLPDGSTPAVGTDVTSMLISAGDISSPAASNALMFTLGGGTAVPLVQHWAVDIGYRYSRIAADSTLSSSPINTNVMTFGLGYRF